MQRHLSLPSLMFSACLTTLVATVACGGDDESGTGGSGAGAGGSAQTGGSGPMTRVDMILALQGDATSGGTIYQGLCGSSSCHGPSGNDGASNAADHTVVVPMLSDEAIVTQVIDGGGAMPAQSLEDQEVADVLAYLRATFD